jgi:ADP-ribose pyrophosphatase YjhB (NUDIX family)
MDNKPLQAEQAQKQTLTEAEFLATYNPGEYERPSATVDTLVFTVADRETSNYRKLPEKALKVLLIRRGGHPFMGQWALPGGFVQMTESLDEAARRELREETNVDDAYMEQLYTWGEVKRDPRMRVISTSYLSLVDSSKLTLSAGDDASDARWFTVTLRLAEERLDTDEHGYAREQLYRLEAEDGNISLTALLRVRKTVEGRRMRTERTIIESNGFAFDHAEIIAYGVERLRSKVEYTDIAIHLMPERFALTALQQVYEVILDRELLKANFRRKIAGMVRGTSYTTKDAGHRPSQLYIFNPHWQEEQAEGPSGGTHR